MDVLERMNAAKRMTGEASCIAVDKMTYEQIRNRLNPANILYDEETGRELLRPPAIFLSRSAREEQEPIAAWSNGRARVFEALRSTFKSWRRS